MISILGVCLEGQGLLTIRHQLSLISRAVQKDNRMFAHHAHVKRGTIIVGAQVTAPLRDD